MHDPMISCASIVRIVCDLIGAEVTASRGRDPREANPIDEATRLDEHGLALDSLERLNASAAVSEFFHIHEYGTEDYLLALRTVGAWCDLVADALPHTSRRLTFRTSGSTGVPKRCTHRFDDLCREVDGWAERFDPSAIVGLVPAHHIYGTLFTVLLADRMNLPCREARWSPALLGTLAPRTLVVATPTQWARAVRLVPAFPAGITGVTSTAPMPAEIGEALRAQGLATMTEVCGSSETAGIAARELGELPYTLLPHIARDGDALVRAGGGGHTLPIEPPDALVWLDDRRFVLGARQDDMVQVGGVNVAPAHIAALLRTHPDVADANVRLDPASSRLKAFVVPAGDALIDEAGFADTLDRWCGERLTTVQRPRRFDFGTVIPHGATGKPADW